MWARVVNLPFNLLRLPWVEKIAYLVGDVRKVDADAKGCAWGEFLRVRVWVNVAEPLRRWLKINSVRRKVEELYDIQYENLLYFCFSPEDANWTECMGKSYLWP